MHPTLRRQLCTYAYAYVHAPTHPHAPRGVQLHTCRVYTQPSIHAHAEGRTLLASLALLQDAVPTQLHLHAMHCQHARDRALLASGALLQEAACPVR